MSDMQQKYTRHTNKKKNMTHHEGEKNQSIERALETSQKIELVDKHTKTAIISKLLM